MKPGDNRPGSSVSSTAWPSKLRRSGRLVSMRDGARAGWWEDVWCGLLVLVVVGELVVIFIVCIVLVVVLVVIIVELMLVLVRDWASGTF